MATSPTNPTNLNPNPVEAAVQALRDRKQGVHASPDDLLRIIARLLNHHRETMLKQYRGAIELVGHAAEEVDQINLMKP